MFNFEYNLLSIIFILLVVCFTLAFTLCLRKLRMNYITAYNNINNDNNITQDNYIKSYNMYYGVLIIYLSYLLIILTYFLY